MEIPNHNSEILLNECLNTNHCSDVENVELDYGNYLTDIENFFRKGF